MNQFVGSPIPIYKITTGPDGNLWFTEYQNHGQIGTIAPDASYNTNFNLPAGSWPQGITLAPDGNLWFTEPLANKIGQMSPTGMLLGEYTVPMPSSTPNFITVGPDGNLWFTEQDGNKLGRINVYGAFAGEYTIPTPSSSPQGITLGPDGNLWFAESNGNKIGVLTPNGGFTEFPVPTANSSPYWITAGPDNNLWFTEEHADKIGRTTVAGEISEFVVPTAGSSLSDIVAGSDGNLWFTEYLGNKLGQITPAGIITEYVVPTPNSRPGGITVGPDGNIWFTEGGAGQIGQYINDATSPWTTLPPMPTARHSPVAAAINGLLYVAGGHRGGSTGTSPALEAYDPSADTWSSLAPLPNLDGGDAGRYGGAAGVIDGKLYVPGGWRTNPPLPTSTLQVYDPATNSWSRKADMPILSGCSCRRMPTGCS